MFSVGVVLKMGLYVAVWCGEWQVVVRQVQRAGILSCDMAECNVFVRDGNNEWTVRFNAKYTALAAVCWLLTVFSLFHERWICWRLQTGYRPDRLTGTLCHLKLLAGWCSVSVELFAVLRVCLSVFQVRDIHRDLPQVPGPHRATANWRSSLLTYQFPGPHEGFCWLYQWPVYRPQVYWS
jgi:hypothetical protein